MKPIETRKRRGEETMKKYRSISGTDCYACATDAIVDILLAVCETPQDAAQLLRSAEIDYTNAGELDRVVSEG